MGLHLVAVGILIGIAISLVLGRLIGTELEVWFLVLIRNFDNLRRQQTPEFAYLLGLQ
jgi:hypothetical protein